MVTVEERLAYAWWNAAAQVYGTDDYREACKLGWQQFLKAKKTRPQPCEHFKEAMPDAHYCANCGQPWDEHSKQAQTNETAT